MTDEQLRRVVDTLTGRLRDEIVLHVHAAATEIGALTRADSEHAAADALDSSARVVDAFRALDDARSMTTILDTLAARAAREAGRAAILLVRGDRIRGWRFVGFESESGASDSLDVALDDCGLVGDAVRTNTATISDGADPTRAPSFAASPTVRNCFAAPIPLGGEVVAVLYADDGNAHPERSNPESRVPNPVLEIMARHATRCLEALIAFKAARALSVSSPDPVSPHPSDASGEDEIAARRYARLLISEIRLYHEDAVAAGRRERDLATRLGGEIARARMLYEQRVAARVRQRADYFQDELVRTLANGDPALLELRT